MSYNPDDRPERRPDEAPDATAPFRPVRHEPGPAADPWRETAPHVEDWPDRAAPADQTAPIEPAPIEPAATPAGAHGDESERWTARANVRRPVPEQWVEEEDPYQGRSWFTPVIVGVVGLLLLGALTAGLFLIYRATENGENAPGGEAPVASAGSSAVPSPTLPATSAPPPSSEAPATSAAPPAGPVTVPRLRGMTLAEATVRLQVLGLDVAVERKADDSLPPGEVLETRPDAGETVQAGGTVTVVVATAPTRSPSRSAVPSAS